MIDRMASFVLDYLQHLYDMGLMESLSIHMDPFADDCIIDPESIEEWLWCRMSVQEQQAIFLGPGYYAPIWRGIDDQ